MVGGAMKLNTRRMLEVVLATAALAAAAPLLVVASIGIALSDPGPILYRARRIGKDRRRPSPTRDWTRAGPDRRQSGYGGREFILYKLRTMRVDGSGGPITANNDSRVFRFGAWLRAAKIDELPQLLNVICGDMALVGPRPEAPEIVRDHYKPEDLETLQVLPGITSAGSLYYYAHWESVLDTNDVTRQYVERILPAKLAVDRAYLQQATFFSDLRIILLTAVAIVSRVVGRPASITHAVPAPPSVPAERSEGLPSPATTQSDVTG
jgi:lipopolysaccharide/colanic/teichoic acid biosynthesis glycosyltransferase